MKVSLVSLFLQPLTKSLLAAAFLSSFGSSLLYGYNLAVVNSPAEVGAITSNTLSISIKMMAKHEDNDDIFHSFNPKTADHLILHLNVTDVAIITIWSRAFM